MENLFAERSQIFPISTSGALVEAVTKERGGNEAVRPGRSHGSRNRQFLDIVAVHWVSSSSRQSKHNRQLDSEDRGISTLIALLLPQILCVGHNGQVTGMVPLVVQLEERLCI
jgi:hypothetical protein